MSKKLIFLVIIPGVFLILYTIYNIFAFQVLKQFNLYYDGAHGPLTHACIGETIRQKYPLSIPYFIMITKYSDEVRYSGTSSVNEAFILDSQGAVDELTGDSLPDETMFYTLEGDLISAKQADSLKEEMIRRDSLQRLSYANDNDRYVLRYMNFKVWLEPAHEEEVWDTPRQTVFLTSDAIRWTLALQWMSPNAHKHIFNQNLTLNFEAVVYCHTGKITSGRSGGFGIRSGMTLYDTFASTGFMYYDFDPKPIWIPGKYSCILLMNNIEVDRFNFTMQQPE